MKFILMYIISLLTVLALWNLLGFGIAWILEKISPKTEFLGDVIRITFIGMSYVIIFISYIYALQMK